MLHYHAFHYILHVKRRHIRIAWSWWQNFVHSFSKLRAQTHTDHLLSFCEKEENFYWMCMLCIYAALFNKKRVTPPAKKSIWLANVTIVNWLFNRNLWYIH
jgi:hypothetical protein